MTNLTTCNLIFDDTDHIAGRFMLNLEHKESLCWVSDEGVNYIVGDIRNHNDDTVSLFLIPGTVEIENVQSGGGFIDVYGVDND